MQNSHLFLFQNRLTTEAFQQGSHTNSPACFMLRKLYTNNSRISSLLMLPSCPISPPMICQIPFGILKLLYLLLDGISGNQLIHRNLFGLPDTVCPVGCLILHCLIPPWVIMNHNICPCKIQAEPRRVNCDSSCPFTSLCIFLCSDISSSLKTDLSINTYFGSFFSSFFSPETFHPEALRAPAECFFTTPK